VQTWRPKTPYLGQQRRVLLRDNGRPVQGSRSPKGHQCRNRPESQEPVERQNRTIISTLTKSLQQFGKSRVDHLKYVEWSYNATPITKTGMSPYIIFFAREPPLPSVTDLAGEDIKDKSARGHIQKLKERVKAIHDEAQKRMEGKRAEEAEV
jgi:hypothetical protein